MLSVLPLLSVFGANVGKYAVSFLLLCPRVRKTEVTFMSSEGGSNNAFHMAHCEMSYACLIPNRMTSILGGSLNN